MTTKHTPAPWVQEGNIDDGDFFIYNEDSNQTVLEIRQGEFNENNLTLILAAPDLLEALIELTELVYGCFAGFDEQLQKSRVAIAKATQ